MSEHRDYSKRDIGTEPSGKHLTKRGYNVSDMRVLVLEQVKSKDPFVLRAQKSIQIIFFDTFRKYGLNNKL